MPGISHVARRAVLAVLATSLIAGTAVGATAAGLPPFEIDSIASLTGAGAFIGQGQQDTLARVEASVNGTGGIRGRAIHFVVYDDQTNPQTAVQLANQILAKKATLLIGPTVTPTCLAIMPLVQEKMVQWCGSPGIRPPKASYSFSSSVSTLDLFKAYLRYFGSRGLKRIALLVPNDAVGQDADRYIAGVLALPENKNITLVAHEYMNNADISVAAQIARIKAANPQALIAWTIGTPTATVLHGLNDAGLDVPVALSNANMTFAAMKQWAGVMPKETYFPGERFMAGASGTGQQKAALKAFFDQTEARSVRPDFQTGLFWDPAMILVNALRALGTGATATQIHDYIEQLHDYAGIAGVYDFRDGSQRGLSQKDVIIMRWDAAKNNWIAVSRFGGYLDEVAGVQTALAHNPQAETYVYSGVAHGFTVPGRPSYNEAAAELSFERALRVLEGLKSSSVTNR